MIASDYYDKLRNIFLFKRSSIIFLIWKNVTYFFKKQKNVCWTNLKKKENRREKDEKWEKLVEKISYEV